MKAVLLESDGTASVFWYFWTSDSAIQIRAAAQNPGDAKLGAPAEFAATHATWPTQAVSLGNRRYAIIQLAGAEATSTVVDMSSMVAPTLSKPVTLSVLGNSQIVSTPSNGAFIVGPDVPAGAIDMGGGAMAQGRPAKLPDGYRNLWWSTLSPLGGGPSAWWAFSAVKEDSSEMRIYLGLLGLDDGWLGNLEDRISKAWSENYDNTYQCWDYNNTRIDVNDYGKLRAIIGWTQSKAESKTGCEIVADGVTLTDAVSHTRGRPIMGGADAGPLVLWEEHDATETTNIRFRIVWRARDDRTHVWNATNRLSTHAVSVLTGRATAPNGLVAFSWLGCDDASGSRCTAYLTKVVQGVWSTQTLGNRGPTSTFSTELAINIRGEAIAIWRDDLGDQCNRMLTDKCARIFGFRF